MTLARVAVLVVIRFITDYYAVNAFTICDRFKYLMVSGKFSLTFQKGLLALWELIFEYFLNRCVSASIRN